jgi:hypothetical protein
VDKVNSPVGWWLRAISWIPNYGAVVQPSQNAVEPADSSFGDRVQVLGLRGVRHAADGVGGMLGLAPNGMDTPMRFGSTRLAAGGPITDRSAVAVERPIADPQLNAAVTAA